MNLNNAARTAIRRNARWLLRLTALMNGAMQSLYDTNLATTLREAFVRPSAERLAAELSETQGQLSGNSLHEEILKKLTAPIDDARKWFEQGACFVAGTLVHTKDGLKPIEQIKVGDYVLSKPESGKGDKAYKQVVNTFVHENQTVREICYSALDGSYDGILIVTDNHPFWVVGVGWTRADLVENGQELELTDGKRVMVCVNCPIYRTPKPGIGWIADFGDIGTTGCNYDFINRNTVEIQVPVDTEVLDSDDPYIKLRVYNFEVEEFHTYYVGKIGVWVHNADCAVALFNTSEKLGTEKVILPDLKGKAPESVIRFNSETELKAALPKGSTGYVVVKRPSTNETAAGLAYEDGVIGRIGVDGIRFEYAVLFENKFNS